jgi:GST-like protein
VKTLDAYRQKLWRQLEDATVGPWFLGERFSALDLFIAVMTHWGPKRPWFEKETPKLFAIARRADALPELTEVWRRNWPT